MKKKKIICIVVIILIMLLLVIFNYRKIKVYILYGFDTCNGNCSSISDEQLNSMGVALLKCPICSKEYEVIPNMIICSRCSSNTGRCTKCGKIIKIEKNNTDIDLSDYNVLVESSYINYAWLFTYSGTIICNNGQIYEFNVDDSQAAIDKYNLAQSQYAKRKEKTVSEADLILMKEYISQIGTNYEERQTAVDAGSESISVYKNDEDKKIILEESGDLSRKNTSQYTEDLLNLIKKYI